MMERLCFIPIVVSALMAFMAVSWVYFKILRIALDKNLVDNPDARKLQKRPIPVMGGMAVFFGLLVGVLAGTALSLLLGMEPLWKLLPVICALSVMLYIGAMDDIHGLSPRARLTVEILVVLGVLAANGMYVDSLHGLWGVERMEEWFAIVLTVFAGVGIVNAVNMIDGVNGLSSGLCMLCLSIFGGVFVYAGDWTNALLAFATMAALLPFFIHNVFGLRSRMFIGDAGTMVMGMELTWLLIATLSSKGTVAGIMDGKGIGLVAFALAVLALPVADTLRVMTMRMVYGRSPFSPDKTHLHHVFVAVGMSHFFTTMSELIIAVSVVVCWIASVWMGADKEVQLYVVIGASVMFVWGTYALLRYHAMHNTELLHRITAFSVRTHWGRTEWWRSLSAWLDRSCKEEQEVPNAVEEQQQKARLAMKFQHVDPENYKEQDRQKILQFMMGRAEVMVEDIYKHSGANPLRVYSILFEEKMKGDVVVIKEDTWGSPEIVALAVRNI